MNDKNTQDERSQLMVMSGMGLEFAGSIIGMGFLGWLIDQWANTGKTWTIVFAVMGIIGGGYNFLKRARTYAKRQDAIYRAKHARPPATEKPPKEREIALPVGRMIGRALVAFSIVLLVGGGVAVLFGTDAVIGVAMGGVASLVASIAGLLMIGPTKHRPVASWHGLLFAAQAISLPITATIALALLYSATQPSRMAALPVAAVVFITVWIVFAKAYGRAAAGSQSDPPCLLTFSRKAEQMTFGHIITLAAGDNPLGHVLDKPLLGDVITMNTLTMALLAVALVVILSGFAGRIGTGDESEGNERYITKGRFAQMFEVIVLYLRDTVIRPQLGKQANTFTPFLLTLFFFILINNLMGLVPLLDLQHFFGALFLDDPGFAVVGGTATGRLAVTGGLAVIAFILWHINSFRKIGVKGWAHHFLGGGPLYLAPIMVPVELMGTFVKPFALALRLFANMTAGHVLLAVLIGFTLKGFGSLGLVGGTPIALVSILSGVAIMFLELFAMARQPEASGTISTNMLIAAALVEGATLFAVLGGFLALL
ncbi:atpB2 [Symbiodinium necroappetens]|uniref:F-ATPase protein 6 n=1 Tax=Symbiodinium necroappetens TaxID=1628268 RepID=A0A812YQD6_9DINO|nr:atpB2 [Symbiodinium necroappetens]